MATFTDHKPGDFCWAELGTSDQGAARAFYDGLFGWTAQDNPIGPSEVYTMFSLDGKPVGGGFRVGPGTSVPNAPPHWDIYVAVSSADETAGKAADAGGTILKKPFDVFVFGRMAVIQDPTGGIFCIWEPKQHPGMGVKNEEGAFCWAELSTSDPAKAKQFYEKVFGWSVVSGESPVAGYLNIKNGDAFIGGITSLEQSPEGARPHWLLSFQTANCNTATRKAANLGAQTLMAPLEMPKIGTVSVLADPQGAVFALFEPPAYAS